MSSKKYTEWTGRISKALFVLICAYAAVSLYILLWRIGVLPALPQTDADAMWLNYSIYSFAMVIIIAVFHLSETILRKKK
jgi:hypothetical protein